MSDTTYRTTIRPRRQVTVPRQALDKWGLSSGDVLEWQMIDDGAKVLPKKSSVDALLDKIELAFKESGIPESEFQEIIIRDRKKYASIRGH